MSIKSVPLRQLGKDGPKVPALGFGLMGLSYDNYGSYPDDEERFALLDKAYELGARNWDSAEYVGLNTLVAAAIDLHPQFIWR